MSAHQRMAMGTCSSSIRQTYRAESSNLKAHNSFCYKGLILCKTVGMEPGVIMKCRSLQQKLSPPTCGPPLTRMLGLPSATLDTWATRTVTAQVCEWLQFAEPVPSYVARSLWWWRGRRPTPPRAPEPLPPPPPKQERCQPPKEIVQRDSTYAPYPVSLIIILH